MSKRSEIVEELNQRFALLAGAGKVRVMRFADDDTFTLESMFDFHNWHANDTIRETVVNSKGDSKIVETPISEIWRTHPDRRQFEGIVFDPRDKPTRAFNMWRGLSVEADPSGRCRRFLEHLRTNVCGGNEEHFNWLVGWIAHLIQRPWEKPGVALVLKGPKGVGKSIVGEILRELIAHHTVTVSQPRHLVGNFNAHLARAVLVLVEEAFWAGDKTAEGALKDQITGPTIRVERKGFDVEELPSFHRFIITGNADWIVPATHDDRRYAVFNVSDAHQQDRRYFGAMLTEMRAGGYEALMHHLQSFDLSLVAVSTAPRTVGLAQQQIENLHNVQRWWFELLSEGAFPDWADAEGDWSEGATSVPTEQFRKCYERWHSERRFQGELARADTFGRDLRALCSSAKRKQRRVKGAHVRFYDLPPLRIARAEFEGWLRCDEPLEWSEG